MENTNLSVKVVSLREDCSRKLAWGPNSANTEIHNGDRESLTGNHLGHGYGLRATVSHRVGATLFGE